jgi:hypothetical protein
MKYAIINTFNNAWEYEANTLEEIQEMAVTLKATGMSFVIVEVLERHGD